MTFSLFISVLLAFVLGLVVGWYARRVVKRRPKQEDRNAGLQRYQAFKDGKRGASR